MDGCLLVLQHSCCLPGLSTPVWICLHVSCVATCTVEPLFFFFFPPQQSMHSALSEHCFHLTSLLPSDYFLLLLLLLHSRQKGLLLLLSVSDSISLLFPLFSAPSMTCICSGCQSRVTEAEQRGGCLRVQPLLFLFSFDYSCAIPD